MISWILKKIVGNQNQRRVERIKPIAVEINALEEELQSKPDDYLREKTAAWKEHLARYDEYIEYFSQRKIASMETEEREELLGQWIARTDALAEEFPEAASMLERLKSVKSADADTQAEAISACQTEYADLKDKFPDKRAAYLDEILPEAYAVVKNCARRLCGQTMMICDHPIEWNMVHFDVQLVGGIALHRGSIAEMATGEGKTLVATLPVYLNALTGLGVHVVTVNDYLARRDSEWMGELFRWLGLSVGCIQNSQPSDLRREQYHCDITYGTASEFGFDYLRDNGMADRVDRQVQRMHYFALIDEVDSVLIDEARTPLIISGPVASSTHQFDRYKPMIAQLVKKQIQLCNGFANDAKKAYDAGDLEEAGLNMFRAKLGQPRNKVLLRLMEQPDARKALDTCELSFYKDMQKTALFALKEEMYFTIDEKTHDADLTEMGRTFLNPDDPDAFVLPDFATAFSEIDGDKSLSEEKQKQAKAELQQNMDAQAQRIHSITQLLKAYCLFEKEKDYIIQENKVVIVDENTGRPMPGRRWSDGLHQAVEAKEGVKIDQETQTLATVTIQNYFRMYEKMGGMTGTAETEAAEFKDIYGVDVTVVPTNKPVQRIDANDKVFKSEREKLNAVIAFVKECHEKGQPVLLGTASEKSSEKISRLLKMQKIPHNVLNAKHHRQEAEIVAGAGLEGSVTVATNMAGRGTDIKLGPGVTDLGGLQVVGTERHSSRRIDRQLRGRCARQGDPGASVFYVSFEDELMQRYGASERMTKLLERFNIEEGQELEGGLLTKTIEMAQKRVEERNYTIRKRVLQYDDVMNQQREVIYGYRNEVLSAEEPHELVMEVIDEALPARISEYVATGEEEGFENDYEGLLHWLTSTFPIRIREKPEDLAQKTPEEIEELIVGVVKDAYNFKMDHENPETVDDLERHVILLAIDDLWREHLYAMDGLREGIGFRQQAQKDPLVEYKKEGYELFVDLMDNIKAQVLTHLFAFRTRPPESAKTKMKAELLDLFGMGDQPRKAASGDPMAGVSTSGGGSEEGGPKLNLPIRREMPKVGRNEPCPCGSGKKFKQCHGKNV